MQIDINDYSYFIFLELSLLNYIKSEYILLVMGNGINTYINTNYFIAFKTPV